ncbi:unnamed protein product [Brassica oleracea]
MGGFKRWRWPITGKENAGDGGRFSFRPDLLNKNLINEELRSRRTENGVRTEKPTNKIFGWRRRCCLESGELQRARLKRWRKLKRER